MPLIASARLSSFTGASGSEEWLALWTQLRLGDLPGFPLWEEAVHNVLREHHPALLAIFDTYAAGLAAPGREKEMDKSEFYDFVTEAGVLTKAYSFEAMCGQFVKANEASADNVLDLRWRQKIPLPFLANLPLMVVYHASGGLTGVAVPNQACPSMCECS